MRAAPLSFTLCTLALVAVPAFAQEPTPPAAPPAAAAPEAPPAVVDPLQEARDLIEVAANTKENLKKGITLYEAKLTDATIPAKVRADGYADVARAWLRYGDLETANAAKIEAYGKGRVAAQKGIALDARNTEALFWDNANLATTGRTNGVMNSLFMIGDLKKGLNHILEINPRHSYARHTLAEIDHAVPGIAGGSDDRAEKNYLEVMKNDPNFTPTMVKLAEFYKDKGKDDEAKKWATKCINAPRSSVPNDWKKFNKKDAQKVLKDLE